MAAGGGTPTGEGGGPRRQRSTQNGEVRVLLLAGDRAPLEVDGGPAGETSAGEGVSTTRRGRGTTGEEWPSVILLVVLYCLQGVPLGLTLGSVPFLLQEALRKSGHADVYSQLATFGLAVYPYSLKLLWSPLVDTYFSHSFGKRKSWVVPSQVGIGLMMLYMGRHIEGDVRDGNVTWLSALCFLLVALVATQDIAVDGWAVSMLPPACRHHGATCQSVGQSVGYFLSYSVFLALNSPDFCNTYLRSAPAPEGLVSLGGVFHFWGVVYLVVTLAVAVFKDEAMGRSPKRPESLRDAYWSMMAIARRPAVRALTLVLLTSKIAFAAADGATVLKLTERGFPKEHLALLAVLQFPCDVIFPVIVGRMSAVSKPLDPWLGAYIPRVLMTVAGAVLVRMLPGGGGGGGGGGGSSAEAGTAHAAFGWGHYGLIFCFQLAYSFLANVMFVNQNSFFSRIADPALGATYMTLLNTFSNLGGTWPAWVVLRGIDKLTCPADGDPSSCLSPPGTDGYEWAIGLGVVIGIAWFVSMRGRVRRLRELPDADWLVPKARGAASSVASVASSSAGGSAAFRVLAVDGKDVDTMSSSARLRSVRVQESDAM